MNARLAASIGLVDLLASTQLRAATLCFENHFVKQLGIGWNEGPAGPDHGDSLYVTVYPHDGDSGASYALNSGFNMDSGRGRGIHRALVLAVAQRLRVTGYDHHPPYCDDIDELWVTNE